MVELYFLCLWCTVKNFRNLRKKKKILKNWRLKKMFLMKEQTDCQWTRQSKNKKTWAKMIPKREERIRKKCVICLLISIIAYVIWVEWNDANNVPFSSDSILNLCMWFSSRYVCSTSYLNTRVKPKEWKKEQKKREPSNSRTKNSDGYCSDNFCMCTASHVHKAKYANWP